MNQKGGQERKLFDILKEKKYLRYLTYAKLINRTGSSLYNLALLTLASKQTYSTLAISLVKLFADIPSLIDPILAYLTDHETKRVQKASLLNSLQVLIYFSMALLMFNYQVPLSFFLLIILGNIISDIFDGYISSLFAPFSKTWVASNERRIFSSFSLVMFSLSFVTGQLLGAGWLVLFPNNFWGLALINALTFAVSLLFLKRINYDDTVKVTSTLAKHFSFGDFFQKMREAYVHMQEHHVIQTMWLLAFTKESFASFSLLLNVAMVSDSNLRIGSYAQTLVVLQVTSFIGLSFGPFFG